MNTNFESLPLLNAYLDSHIKRMDQCEDKHAEINHLIQVMRQNEGLLKAEISPPEALAKFLKSVTSLKEAAPENADLTNVTSAAMSVFTHLRTDNIAGSLNAIHQLKEVGSEIYYQTLADWIAEGKIQITTLHLAPDEIHKLAPYLTYLSIEGNEYSDEFIGELLENTKKLKTLEIVSNNLEGHAFARFKNTEHLQILIIKSCPNLNQPLPKRLDSLKVLSFVYCPVFDQLLPDGMVELNRLIILECPFKQKLPEGLSALYGVIIPNYPKEIALEFLSSRYESDIEQGLALTQNFGIDHTDLIKYSLSRKFPEQANQIDTWMKEEKFHYLWQMEIPFIKEFAVKNNPLLQLLLFQLYSHSYFDDSTKNMDEFLAPFVKNPETLAPFASRQGAESLFAIKEKCEEVLTGRERRAFLNYLNGTENLPITLNFNLLLASWIAEEKIPLNTLKLSEEALLDLAPHLTYLTLNSVQSAIFTDDFIGQLLEKTNNLTELNLDNCGISQRSFAQLKDTKKLKVLSIKADLDPKVNYILPPDLSALQTLDIQCEGFNRPLPKEMEHLQELRIRSSRFNQPLPTVMSELRELIMHCSRFNHPLPETLTNLQTLVIDASSFNKPLPDRLDALREFTIHSNQFDDPLPEWVSGLTSLKIACSIFKFPLPSKMDNLQNLDMSLCYEFNQLLPRVMPSLKKLTMTDCQSFNQTLPEGMDKLERIECFDCPAFNTVTIMRFLFPIMQKDRVRALELAQGLLPEKKGINRETELGVYDYFIKQNPDQIDTIVEWVEKIKPEVLVNVMDAVKDQISVVKGDPLQQIFIYGICAKIPQDKIPLLKKVLKPIMKTPMDLPLQKFYERIRSLNNPEEFLEVLKAASPPESVLEDKTYHELLAGWIAENKIPLNSLEFSVQELIELAPHLTYLSLENIRSEVFTDKVIGQLLAKTNNLTELKIEYCNISNTSFAQLKDTKKLRVLSIYAENQVNYDLPPDLSALQKLVIISANFDRPLPEGMVNLQTLMIRGRDFNQPLPKGMEHLQELFISSHNFDQPLSSVMPGLRELIIQSNRFNHPLPETLTNLQKLVINSSSFNKPLPERLDALQDFTIHSNHFDQPLPEWASGLTSLNISCPQFNQPLPKRMPSLLSLTIINYKALNQQLPEGMDDLVEIHCNNCPAFNNVAMMRFLFPIMQKDRVRALELAKGLLPEKKGINRETELGVYEYFIKQNPDQIDAIAEWVEKITPEVLNNVGDAVKNQMSIVEGDPLQQIFIYGICAKLPQDKIPLLKPLLEQIIRTPMDPPLQQFYERILTMKNPEDLLQSLITANPSRIAEITSRYQQDREKLFKFLPFLIHVDAEKNLNNLEKTGHLDLFLDKFSYGKEAVSIIATEDLFIENSEENAKTIKLISDLESEFNNLKNTISIPRMPWAKEAESLAQTPAGKAFIKLHFHDIVLEPQLQEIILRAFPPGNPENLALYPMKSEMKEESELDIHVVPTLPIADAPRLLKLIISSIESGRIKIYYYGSPGADASGLGRQFVSEVIQGYIVNQKSLFIRTLGGEMYPYDPTHRLGAHANRESYKALGMFLGMALKWQHPTGKVLSEKALNCMLAFTQEDLKDDHFDISALVAKMDPVAFIKFMKDATIEDDESVKLYEQVFLSDDSEVVLKVSRNLNDLLMDDDVDVLIAGGAGNIEQIREHFRTIWVGDQAYSLSALHAIAQGMMLRLPNKIGDSDIVGWDDVRNMGAKELSKHLQGELTPQYVKEHIHVRVMLGETPEKRQTADNVRQWTDEWIDSNGNDPEKLANFVQAFSGARAMTKDIHLDINPEYHTIEAHTCFNRCDIPIGVKEGLLKLMWDDYATGNLDFTKA